MDKQQRRQDHFNKAYLGVIAQGGPSKRVFHGSESCAYQGDNGRKCAVGHILTDDELVTMGGFCGSVGDLWQSQIRNYDHPFNKDATFYEVLQSAHDDFHDLDEDDYIHHFKVRMMSIALECNLQLPKVGDETATA